MLIVTINYNLNKKYSKETVECILSKSSQTFFNMLQENEEVSEFQVRDGQGNSYLSQNFGYEYTYFTKWMGTVKYVDGNG